MPGMHTIDEADFDGGSLELAVDPGARPTTAAPRTPAMPSFRRCFAHDLPLDPRGDCPQCSYVRREDARRAARRSLLGLVLAAVLLTLGVGGFLAIRSYEANADKRAAAALTARYDRQMVVFTTQGCPACKIARAYMDRHGIQYVERSLDGDRQAVLELDSLGQRPLVPTFVIGDQVLVGFNQLELERALAEHQVPREAPLGP